MDTASALIDEFASPQTLERAIPAFAQMLMVLAEFITPVLYAWNMMDASRARQVESEPSASGRSSRGIEEIFDFIVVGGGSAGSVVANRLSENYRVLLLEAGGTPSALLRIPLLTYILYGRPPIDWMFETVPQKAAGFGLNNNVCRWPAGKALGGSSNINGMIFIRGNSQGFDLMANRTNDSRWSFQNMLKIYKGLEDYHGYFDESKHGKGGRMPLEKADMQIASKQFVKAGGELGYAIRDPNTNGPLTDGFGPMEFNLKHGRRWTAYHGYLRDIMGTRKTLTVRKYTEVTKVLLDSRNRAYGVEYVQDGHHKKAHAKKEVILSAGAINSAKLLMLSGIGPKEHLEELGIEVKVDSPVGNIMQDKYGALLGPFTSAKGTSFLRERDLTTNALSEWVISGTGPIQSCRTEATYTLSSSYAKADGSDWLPDMHSYFLAYSVDERNEKEFHQSFNFKPKILRNYFGVAKGLDSFLQLVTINRPTGTGTLRLKSKDPFDKPLLDPKYLQNPRDVAVLVEAIKVAVKVVEETEAFKKINASLLNIPVPGCEKPKFKSDAYYECVGRSQTVTAFKYGATAPMGKDRSDPEAVVDSDLRVIGTKGLRVVDGSVLQEREVSVNHVTVQAIAELASAMIKDTWTVKHRGLSRGRTSSRQG